MVDEWDVAMEATSPVAALGMLGGSSETLVASSHTSTLAQKCVCASNSNQHAMHHDFHRKDVSS